MDSLAQIPLDRPFLALGKEWPRFHVKRAWLFGSRARKGATARSDWDFLVEFYQPPDFDTFMGLRSRLQESLKGRVDILSRNACTSRFLEAIESDLIDVT